MLPSTNPCLLAREQIREPERQRMRAAGRAAAAAVVIVVAVLALLMNTASAFYVPGVAPQDFTDGEPVAIKVGLSVSM